MSVNSGVSSVLFQGWGIDSNNIISLGLSMKLEMHTKETSHGAWLLIFLWRQIILKQHIFRLFLLAEMELYIWRRVSKN